jgi:hypothetical protein
LLAGGKGLRHSVIETSQRVAPKSLLRSKLGVMPQPMDERREGAYVAAIPDNDSPLISKA